MNPDFYINVAKLMKLPAPKCRLPRPRLKPKVIVNHDEWLKIIDGDTGVCFKG